jgi:hypothetical protein
MRWIVISGGRGSAGAPIYRPHTWRMGPRVLRALFLVEAALSGDRRDPLPKPIVLV